MLLPMPSTGALRAPIVDALENMERNDLRGLASFRRKSARTASMPSDLYIGSDIEALTLEKSDECGDEGSKWRRWPKQHRKPTVRRMPVAKPEKNPTRVPAGVN